MFNRLLFKASTLLLLLYYYEFVLQVQNQFMFQIDIKINLTIKHFINNIFSLFYYAKYLHKLFIETLPCFSIRYMTCTGGFRAYGTSVRRPKIWQNACSVIFRNKLMLFGGYFNSTSHSIKWRTLFGVFALPHLSSREIDS